MKYKQNHEESSKLLTQPKVSQRVKEIKQIAAKVVLKKFDYDIEKLFKKITQWIDADYNRNNKYIAYRIKKPSKKRAPINNQL